MHITHVTRPFLKHYIIDNLMQSRLSVTCKWLDILLGGDDRACRNGGDTSRSSVRSLTDVYNQTIYTVYDYIKGCTENCRIYNL